MRATLGLHIKVSVLEWPNKFMNRLIFGCGYLGNRVAKRWRDAGDHVIGVSRSGGDSRVVSEAAGQVLRADVTDIESLASISQLEKLDTLLFAVGYDRSADASIDAVYAKGFRNVLAALPTETKRVVYISTTGVYGGADGGFVDEQTTPNPQRDGGKASLAAENALRESPFADRGVVLRLAGIYGPDRIPFLQQLKAGESIAAPQSGHLNLIHVDDAAEIVIAAAAAESPPQLVCVSDGSPVIRSDYYRQVAKLIDAPEPTFTEPVSGSPRAARASADKQVRSSLIKQLNVELSYPNYLAGLAAILGNKGTGG